MKKVACLLTGNVDSAVAALLLKKRGYSVIGAFIQNDLLPQQFNESLKEVASRAATQLSIDLQEVHIPHEKWDAIKQSAIKEYKDDSSPDLALKYNNDIICGFALDHVLKHFGVDCLATEHFAQISVSSTSETNLGSTHKRMKLLRGVDQHFDDSSVLSGLSQFSLRHLVVPLGEIAKDIVPKIAESAGLHVFINEKGIRPKKFQDMASQAVLQNLTPVRGKFLNVETLLEEDSCENIYLWKPGDKLHIGGKEFVVVEKVKDRATVLVAQGAQHPALYCETFFTGLAHWLTEVPYNFYEKQMMNGEFKTGHYEPVVKGTMTVGATNEYCGNDHIIVSSTVPVKNIVPGSHATFYRGEEVLGCGKILRKGPSMYAMNYRKYKYEK